jgi:hypothetical protein
MAIKLDDCPPSLKAAIMRQLEKEGRGLPITIVRYAMAYQVFGEWKVGPETENKALVLKQVSAFQNRSGRNAFLTMGKNPPAVCVKITRTTQPLKRVEVK